MMKLILVLVFALALAIHGETLDAEDASNREKSDPVIDDALDDEGDFGNDLLENEQQLEDEGDDSMGDANTPEALEESSIDGQSDPYAAIGYYCKFCKACNACKRFGKCSKGVIDQACGYCKYCSPKTYWKMVRRTRIRLRRVRVWGRRRRRSSRRRRRRWG